MFGLFCLKKTVFRFRKKLCFFFLDPHEGLCHRSSLGVRPQIPVIGSGFALAMVCYPNPSLLANLGSSTVPEASIVLSPYISHRFLLSGGRNVVAAGKQVGIKPKA